MSKLIKVWIAVDTLLFASGVFIIVLSRLWAVEDLMLNLVFPPIYLIGQVDTLTLKHPPRVVDRREKASPF